MRTTATAANHRQMVVTARARALRAKPAPATRHACNGVRGCAGDSHGTAQRQVATTATSAPDARLFTTDHRLPEHPKTSLPRDLPNVDTIDGADQWRERFGPRTLGRRQARQAIGKARTKLAAGETAGPREKAGLRRSRWPPNQLKMIPRSSARSRKKHKKKYRPATSHRILDRRERRSRRSRRCWASITALTRVDRRAGRLIPSGEGEPGERAHHLGRLDVHRRRDHFFLFFSGRPA